MLFDPILYGLTQGCYPQLSELPKTSWCLSPSVTKHSNIFGHACHSFIFSGLISLNNNFLLNALEINNTVEIYIDNMHSCNRSCSVFHVQFIVFTIIHYLLFDE